MSSATALRVPTLDEVVARIEGISTLPQVAIQVMEVAGNPNSGAADLKRVVENDPALSARVVKMVNSAAFGLRNKIDNLHQAISYLGLNQVRNLAMTASVSEVFRKESSFGCYRRVGLWRHLVSVGVCARLVASRCGLNNFEDAFLAGLLHDIGIILEDEHMHEVFRQVIDHVSEERSLIEVEMALLGYTHANVGDRVADGWRFPPAIRAAIKHHHAAAAYKGEGVEIVQCVEVANVICTVKGIGSVGVKRIRVPTETFQALGCRREDIVVMAGDLDRELATNESLFEL